MVLVIGLEICGAHLFLFIEICEYFFVIELREFDELVIRGAHLFFLSSNYTNLTN